MSAWAVIPKRLCFINSAYASQGTTSLFYQNMTSSPIRPDPDSTRTTYIAVRSAVIPMSFEAVNSSNNALVVNETQGGITKTFTAFIGAGQYDLVGFQSAVNQALLIASAVSGYTASYNCVVSTSTGQCSFGLTTAGISATLTFDAPTTSNNILGLPTAGLSSAFTNTTVYTGPGLISISGPRYIMIRSQSFLSEYYEARVNAVSNIMLAIPVTASNMQTLTWAPAYPTTYSKIGAAIDTININITDENGVNLNLRNQPVQIEFGIYVSD